MTRRSLALLFTFLTVPAAADEGHRLDVRELPPIPEVVEGTGSESTSSSITVMAATLAGEDIVVGAAKREQSLGTVASAVTVLSGDRLRRFGYRTVAEALRSVAGLYVVDDRMTDRLGIRGVQILGDFNTRILVLVDGATLNEPWNQFVGIGQDLPVALDDVDRIEIVRGPVSSLYGTNAFLAIINIVTRGADRSPRVYGRINTGEFGEIGGNAGFAVGDVNRQIRGTVQFNNRTGETLSFPEFAAEGASPTVTADGIQSLDASLVGHYDGAFAQIRAYSKTRQLAAAPYNAAINDTDNHNIDEMIMAEGGYTRDVGITTLTARLYVNRYAFRDFLVYQPDSSNFTDHGDSTWIGAEMRAHFRILPKDDLGLTIGAEATLDWVESHSYDTDDTLIDVKIPTNFNIEGVYSELNANLTSWATFSGGARFDRNSDWDNKISPRAGLLLHKDDDFGLKLLYAQGFRNPSPLEAFFADQMTFIANPDLKPETIQTFEAVIWARPLPGLNVRLSAFRWNLDDILELVDVGGFNQYQNQSNITSTGLEFEASYRDTTGWYAFASGTFAHVEKDGSVDLAQNAPAIVASGGVSTPKLWNLFHVSTELQFIGERRTRDPDLMADANLRWNLAVYLPTWNHMDLTLGVRNIIGTREQIPAQIDYDRDTPNAVNVYVIPGEGREIFARLGVSY